MSSLFLSGLRCSGIGFVSPCIFPGNQHGRSYSSNVSNSSFRVSFAPLHRKRNQPLCHKHVHNNSPRMQKESNSSDIVIRIVAGLLAGGFILSSVIPLISNLNGQSNLDATVDAQLRRVPLFTVTDSTGRPFLTESADHKLRQGFFFVQPADATRYLEDLREGTEDAKVLAIGLDEAVKYLDTRTPAKSIPERFDLFPDTHEAELAQIITAGAFQKQFGTDGVPIFYLEGLAVKDDKNGSAVYPLFFEKEKLEEALKNLKTSNPSTELTMDDMQVIDLKQTIKELKVGTNPRLRHVVFIPLSDSLNTLKSMQSDKSPSVSDSTS